MVVLYPKRKPRQTWPDLLTLASREVLDDVLDEDPISTLHGVYPQGSGARLLDLHSESILGQTVSS